MRYCLHACVERGCCSFSAKLHHANPAPTQHFAVYSLEQYTDPDTGFVYTRENVNNVVSPCKYARG